VESPSARRSYLDGNTMWSLLGTLICAQPALRSLLLPGAEFCNRTRHQAVRGQSAGRTQTAAGLLTGADAINALARAFGVFRSGGTFSGTEQDGVAGTSTNSGNMRRSARIKSTNPATSNQEKIHVFYTLKDLHPGFTVTSEPVTLTEADSLRFCREFDPQPVFISTMRPARTVVFGGLAASGCIPQPVDAHDGWQRSSEAREWPDRGIELPAACAGRDPPTGRYVASDHRGARSQPSRSRPGWGTAVLRWVTRNQKWRTGDGSRNVIWVAPDRFLTLNAVRACSWCAPETSRLFVWATSLARFSGVSIPASAVTLLLCIPGP